VQAEIWILGSHFSFGQQKINLARHTSNDRSAARNG
jgi:hypothetical protein